jgi:hypothetical protein
VAKSLQSISGFHTGKDSHYGLLSHSSKAGVTSTRNSATGKITGSKTKVMWENEITVNTNETYTASFL